MLKNGITIGDNLFEGWGLTFLCASVLMLIPVTVLALYHPLGRVTGKNVPSSWWTKSAILAFGGLLPLVWAGIEAGYDSAERDIYADLTEAGLDVKDVEVLRPAFAGKHEERESTRYRAIIRVWSSRESRFERIDCKVEKHTLPNGEKRWKACNGFYDPVKSP